MTKHLHQVLIPAGRTLALRFNPEGMYLRSFVSPESLFIDIMMNVPIIFHAARETDDNTLFRPRRRPLPDHRTDDRSSQRRHRPRRDLQSRDRRISPRIDPPRASRRLRLVARPGVVTLWLQHRLFTYTHDPADLAVARRNADHFIDRLAATFVPPWDFDVPPGPDRIADSSAGAIAASGLWDLGGTARAERTRTPLTATAARPCQSSTRC